MTTSVNIVVILTLLFRSTFTTDSDLWFPKEFPHEQFIKCGMDHEMFGFSIVDAHIYQFDKCSVIIYPPPLYKYIDEHLNQFNLENGYRYQFDKIQPNWQPNYCQQAKQSIIKPQYSLIRLNVPNNEHDKHILLYFTGLLNKNETNLYYAYDFDLHLNTIKNGEKFFRSYAKYLFINNGNEIFFIENEYKKDEFDITKDKVLGFDWFYFGTICIKKSTGDDKNKNIIYRQQISKPCEPDSTRQYTESLLKNIDLSFTFNEKLMLISTKDKIVLQTNVDYLNINSKKEEFSLEIISLTNYFVCKTKQIVEKITLQPITKTTEIKELKTKNKLLIILIPIIIIIICLFIGIFFYFKPWKKKLNNSKLPKTTTTATTSSTTKTTTTTATTATPLFSPSKSALKNNIGKKKIRKEFLAKTIRSNLSP